jgi:hypothetical protein
MPLIKNIAVLIIPLFVILGAGIFLVNSGMITTEKPSLEVDIINVNLSIDYGNDMIDSYTLKISNANVYNVLIKASEEHDFSVKAKYYDQFQSHYIYSINSVEEGENNKFWQYYINGNYGSVGADLQPVKDNDFIEWKYQEPKI